MTLNPHKAESAHVLGKQRCSLRLSGLFCLVLLISILILPVHSAACSGTVYYGTFFYVWYPSHFNGNPPSPWPHSLWNVTDIPFLGWYNSSDPLTIRDQIVLMHYAGINFALISYWNDTETDNNMLAVFKTVSTYLENYGVKLAIDVEPYNESGIYNFTSMETYLYDKFYSPFQNVYFTLDNRPLLVFSQGGNMTNPLANRDALKATSQFTVRIVGNMPYVDWQWWYPSNEFPRTTIPQLSNKTDGGQTTVEPRYDDTYLGFNPYTNTVRNTTFNPYLNASGYQKQWNVANEWIASGSCHIVLIGTWNDYTERTQIEPCYYEKPNVTDPFYLLNITRANILGNGPLHTPNPIWLQILSGIIGAIIASGIVTAYFSKTKKKKERNNDQNQTKPA